MKKIIGIVLAVVTLYVSITALAESSTEDTTGITFQGIPWKSDVETVVHTLIKKEYVSAEFVTEWNFSDEDGFYLRPHDLLSVFPEYDYEVVQSELSVPEWEILKKIAGYEVEQIDCSFVNQSGSKALVAVEIELNTLDFEIAYKDLLSKLTTLYGKSKSVYAGASLYLDIWYGEYDTVLVLMNDNENIKLYYGILSAEELVKESFANMLNDVSSSDISGL